MGPVYYLLTVGIMSPPALGLGRKWPYYESPWEIGADYFGGVLSRATTKKMVASAWLYLIAGTVFPPLAYLFLI